MTKPAITAVDPALEKTLRPKRLSDFIGQEKVVQQLLILLRAAKKRGESPSHILFYGPAGLGKTSLAAIVAAELESQLYTTSGPLMQKSGDMAGLLTNLNEGDVFFIDEIHRLPKILEEYLYPAMEDFSIDLLLDSGANARSVQMKLPPFTFIGATTMLGNLSNPLRSRFGVTIRLDFYDEPALKNIILRSSRLLGVELSEKAAEEMARRSRGTPRIANNLLRWTRDFVHARVEKIIDENDVKEACLLIGLDDRGLGDMDRKMMEFILVHHGGGPVGIKAIASFLGEDENTVASVYEPYLLSQGLIQRTPRGRLATKTAYSIFT
ncbi:MAG: Holliday junction DNA helicase RuvB [Chlamydiae bacterium RIFCSPHIGHO2_12_FULL_49_11]|nr:MAG: Holliday junction DNA helicase RuvB [Chlamydiae bacterium RIFCSPHIGHO2_12_FULL_49_11]